MIGDIAMRAGIVLERAGGLELVLAGQAEAFVDACAATGTRILGIEGFRLSGGDVRPDTGAIADFSAVDARASVVEARRFLADVYADDLAFEFVLAEGP